MDELIQQLQHVKAPGLAKQGLKGGGKDDFMA
jgi:hypothetical protein